MTAHCQNASSQTASIKGFIKEEETSEPVIFTSVYLKGTQYGAVTDINGYYVISKVPAGSYMLMVTSIGYDSIKNPIVLKSGDVILQNLKLKKSNISLKEIDISAENEKEEQRTQTNVAVAKITSKQISQIPAIGGQPDLAQYLQVLPGVISTGDQGGQLYIQGGSPIQNETLLDGMVIYNPFHSIGLFSVFDTDVLRSADVYTGGFGAEYGDRISSVMDITTRDGNKKRMAGKISVSPFGAKILVEGPLKSEKQSGGGSSSFIFSAKNSYLEQSSKVIYKYMDAPSRLSPKEYLNYKDTVGLPFNYTDLYGKLS
ncbi:MAG: TonB-dependent receptor, partial [Bacteroidales bacterium]